MGAIVAVVWVTRNDNRHSPAGIELSKVDGYVDIRQSEIESNERVSLAKLEAYTRTLEKVYGRDNNNADD